MSQPSQMPKPSLPCAAVLSAAALRRRTRAGWSVTELIAALAIMGLMIAMGTPTMIAFWQSMKVRTAAHRMVSHVRLCRQVAVSRRGIVVMVIEGSGLPETYSAWEDKVVDDTRDADGVLPATTEDDELWVVRPDNELQANAVRLIDCFNDVTPSNPDDDPGDSIMVDDTLTLRFFPNGQVLRIDADGDTVQTDTLLRVRLEGTVGGDQRDRWEVSVNRSGKVGTYFKRLPLD
jgi:type II secretory pathway pseudopilin PulG